MSQPQYPQPGGGAYYAPGQPQQPAGQQQQCVVMAPQQPTVVVIKNQSQSFTGHIVLACFVFWCCGGLFGLVAFILALVAGSHAGDSPETARQLGKASIGVSIAGIVVTVLVVIIVIVLYVVVFAHAASAATEIFSAMCKFSVAGNCYASKQQMTAQECESKLGTHYYHTDGYCYY